MQTVGMVLQTLGGIVQLVCFILVLMQMFQHGQTGLAIACIVLVFCCIGGLVTYIYGWVKAGEWNLTTVMLIWTVGVALSIAGGLMNPVTFSGQFAH